MKVLNFKAISLLCLSILFMTMSDLEARPENAQGQRVQNVTPNGSSVVTEVTSEKELKAVANTPGTTVIKFYATWCPACKAADAPYKELAQELSDVTFAQIDVETNPDLAKEYGASGVPHFVFFKDGTQVDTVTGFGGKESLKQRLQQSGKQ